MYAAQPDLSTCNQQQLLQLLLLADRYGVLKVAWAVTVAFASIPLADLQWATVQGLYSLPPGCAELDACKLLFAAAREKLQQELGDLELALVDNERRRLLLSLPQPALLQLLHDNRTRVASENTVFFVINFWWRGQKQQQHGQDAAGSQLQRMAQTLLQQVRMKVRAALLAILQSSVCSMRSYVAEAAHAAVGELAGV
jgi:hypothetical protein